MLKFFPLMKRKVETQLRNISLSHIVSNPFQPRREYDEKRLQELSVSIKKYGIIQPIVARKHGELYELVSGERRVRASRMTGMAEIPAIVGVFSDSEMLEIGILENIQRENLSLLEEAMGFSSMIAFMQPSTQKELAAVISKRLGKDETEIFDKLSILSYLPLLQKALDMGLLTLDHAKLVGGVQDKEQQKQLIEKIVSENFSVQQTEKMIQEMQLKMNDLFEQEKTKVKLAGSQVPGHEVFSLFLHIIENAVDALKEIGLHAEIEKRDTPPYRVTITLL